jgi:uncharacterized membrane protein
LSLKNRKKRICERINNGFLYSNGLTTNLGALGGTFSVGNGINNSGQVMLPATKPRSEKNLPLKLTL